MEGDSQESKQDEIHYLLKRLWSLRREDDTFDQIECELTDAVRCNPNAAHSYYSIAGNPSERQASRLLWHVCALGCSFDVVLRVHFENETACRERQSFQGSLPLHVACKAPHCDVTTISFLVKQFPAGRDELDEEMNYPLHIVLLSHPDRAALARVLQTPQTLTDLTVPWQDRFPLDILDALVGVHQFIALETNPMNAGSQNVIFASTRFHGFCNEIAESLHITIGQQHLEDTLMALNRYRVPLVALNTKFFEELPVRGIAQIHTLRYLFLQKGTIPHDTFADLLQVLSTKDNFTRLHIRSSRSLRGSSPVRLLALTQLEYLDLGHNTIGPSLAEPLAAVLLATTTLQHLDIGGNDIGVPGMRQIYHALRHNKTVQRFDLMGESTDGLLSMLKQHNMTLQSIRTSQDVQEQVAYWGMANYCGRGKLCEEHFTKEDLVNLLVTTRTTSKGKTFGVVDMFYALLGTNPALWSI